MHIGGRISKFFHCRKFKISMNLQGEIKHITMNYIQEIGGKYVIWTDGSRMQMEVLSEDGKEILLMLLIGLLPLKSFMQA